MMSISFQMELRKEGKERGGGCAFSPAPSADLYAEDRLRKNFRNSSVTTHSLQTIPYKGYV